MDNGGYGQNIAAGVKGDNVSAVITELFYNGEEQAYADAHNYGKGGEDPDRLEGVHFGWLRHCRLLLSGSCQHRWQRRTLLHRLQLLPTR
jgi:hypothetical protein